MPPPPEEVTTRMFAWILGFMADWPWTNTPMDFVWG
jgi:hypothetical protein